MAKINYNIFTEKNPAENISPKYIEAHAGEIVNFYKPTPTYYPLPEWIYTDGKLTKDFPYVVTSQSLLIQASNEYSGKFACFYLALTSISILKLIAFVELKVFGEY